VGKAKEKVHFELSEVNVGSLTRGELRAIAASALPPIEAEVTLVNGSLTVQPGSEQPT